MTNADDRRPFSMPYVASVNFISGAMIARAPWPSPVNKYFVLRKLTLTTTPATQSGSVLSIWDQDLSNTTPVGRGSGTSPLLQVPIGGGLSGAAIPTMTVLDIDACPQQYFQAGITVAFNTPANVSGASNLTMELDVI